MATKKLPTKNPTEKKPARKKPATKKSAGTVAAKASTPKKTQPANNKTQETNAGVDAFIKTVADPAKQADARIILALMQKVSGDPPKMWGSAIVGFGNRKLVYESGRELECPTIGFSPRKQNLTLYLMNGFRDYDALLAKLGKHSIGKSCLYINRLVDIDMKVLESMVKQSVKFVKAKV